MRRVDVASATAVTPWYASEQQLRSAIAKRETNQPSTRLLMAKHCAKMEKKRRPKAAGSGSESYSSSSESDGKGNRKSKKSGRCWKGYEPTPGKTPFSEGSCRKKGSGDGDAKSRKRRKRDKKASGSGSESSSSSDDDSGEKKGGDKKGEE